LCLGIGDVYKGHVLLFILIFGFTVLQNRLERRVHYQ